MASGQTPTLAKFDSDWDALREQTCERQKKLGIIPAGTELTKRPADWQLTH